MSQRSDEARPSGPKASVAVAADCDRRDCFVSVDGQSYVRVHHFPTSLEEARLLFSEGLGPSVTYLQLVAAYSGAVAIVDFEAAGEER